MGHICVWVGILSLITFYSYYCNRSQPRTFLRYLFTRLCICFVAPSSRFPLSLSLTILYVLACYKNHVEMTVRFIIRQFKAYSSSWSNLLQFTVSHCVFITVRMYALVSPPLCKESTG